MKMIIDLKTLDGKIFDQTITQIESLTTKKGIAFQKMIMPTKTFEVDSGYQLRIRRAIITLKNPDQKTVTLVREVLKPLSLTVDIEAKRIKNALDQHGIIQEENYIKGKLCSKIEIRNGF